jgi:hypothetical protein
MILGKSMSSAATAMIVKMVESLPDELQEKVVEHIRDYIIELVPQPPKVKNA